MAGLLPATGRWELWHPWTALALLLLGAAYIDWTRRAAHRRHAAVSAGRLACTAAGLALLYAAIGTPLAAIAAHTLFCAYMLQQVLIAFAAAPLLLCGLPGGLVQPLVRRARLTAGIAALTRPVTATVGFHLFFGALFLPGVLDALTAHRAAYLVAAAVLTLAAISMWWPLASPLPDVPPLPDPGQLIYLLVNWLAILVAFGLVLFGRGLPYGAYAGVHLPTGWTPTLDRQLAGAVLGVLSHVAYGVAVITAFFRWASAESHTATPLRLYRRLLAGGFSAAQAGEIAGVRPEDIP